MVQDLKQDLKEELFLEDTQLKQMATVSEGVPHIVTLITLPPQRVPFGQRSFGAQNLSVALCS